MRPVCPIHESHWYWLSCSGFTHECSDGGTVSRRCFVPTIAAFVGDIAEANSVFGILHHASPHSDIGTLVHAASLKDPECQPAVRTESAMRKVCRPAFPVLRYLPVGTVTGGLCYETTTPSHCIQIIEEAIILEHQGDMRGAKAL